MALYSLILVSIGVGGLKSCIAAFGVDQLIENNLNISPSLVSAFFGTFYFSIHLGVLFGLVVSPICSKILSCKGYFIDAYAFRYGLSVFMMTIVIGKKTKFPSKIIF